MNYNNMNYIWTSIGAGVGKHGHFLRAFAMAWLRADPGNLKILEKASKELISKYNLNREPYIDPIKKERDTKPFLG